MTPHRRGTHPPKTALTLALLLLAAFAGHRPCTGAFSPSPSFGRPPPPRSSLSGPGGGAARERAPRSTASDRDIEKDGALTALEKLLDRQRAEVRDTERLIAKLVTPPRNGTDAAGTNGTDLDDDLSSLRSSDVARSILSGADYGFRSRSEGCKFDDLVGGVDGYGPPANVVSLGWQQFNRNLDAIRGEYKDEADVDLTTKQRSLQMRLKQLTLNSTAIWERERSRGPLVAPLLIKIPYLVLCYFLDFVFEGRPPPARFFLLETVARMPYFSYITMLHFYETLGFWRRSADMKRVHFAEEWNEFHHLLIMESLGGDQRWWVRFMAQHSALAYYIALCILWAISPTLSYKFSEMLETHAVDTYGQFLDENEELLKELPPSLAAVEYYSFGASDPFFGEYQTTAMKERGEIRQPGDKMMSLHDVFSAIRADEGDHVSTMKACLDPTVAVNSPSLEKRILMGVALAAAFGYLLSTGDVTDVDGVGEAVDGLVEGNVADGTGVFLEGLLGGIIGGAQKVGEAEEESGLPSMLGEAGFFGTAIWDQIRQVLIDLLEFLTKL